ASHRLVGWYEALARSLVGERTPPDPLDGADSSDGLVSALHTELTSVDEASTATAARMIWTHDYLDAMRRYQGSLVGPAREARRVAAERDGRPLGWMR
ncbi:MAG TPA: hypothetical protein VLK34_06470, partial [Nocardioidaceae bacterium]|nr:hypothetical protein [Nocardioidaceae bacterium]